MLVWIAMNQIKYTFVEFVLCKMHSLRHAALRNSVQWEYINIYASQIFEMHTFN